MFLKIAALVLAGVTSIYPNAGTIQNVDEKADTFCIVDDAGDVWKMSGVEDWQEGDHCAMIMDSNGTENWIYDDIVLSVRFTY